jgi:hypothetical protein
MTWLEAPATLERLEEEGFAEFRKRLPPSDKSTRGDESFQPHEYTEERWFQVERACNVFASEHQWPPNMSMEVWIDCLNRIREAREFSEFVVQVGHGIPWNHAANQFDFPDLLRWLLIDYYHRVGHFRLLYRVFATKKPTA